MPLEGENLSYVRLKFSTQIRRRALIDTGSCANAMPQNLFDELSKNHPDILQRETPQFNSVRMASGQRISVQNQVNLRFSIGIHSFTDSFLILPTMNNVILGNPFFKKHNITIDPKNNLLKLPDFTVQLSELKPDLGTKRKFIKKMKKVPVQLSRKVTIRPHEQVILDCQLENFTDQLAHCTGLVTPSKDLEDKTNIALTSSLSKIEDDNKIFISAINLSDNQITINKNKQIAHFEILNEAQADNLVEVDPQLISLAKMRNPENAENELNQLVQDVYFKKYDIATGRPPPDYSKLWFPTPETCTEISNLTPLQRDIYDQILQFQRLEKLDPQNNLEDRNQFLRKFSWDTCVLNAAEKSKLEDFLVEYHDVFAKHRFDVGYNTELKIKLTPEHSLPVYVQGPPAPIHLRDEILVELALLQYFNIIRTLTHSKYSSPIFCHRKPSGKLRILIDLRRVNHLLRQDYSNNNFPISNMTDATNHFAGKQLFCKLDCSQAYHCVQMADDLSVQLLAFNFASRTFAHNCLAQGLNK